MTTTFQDRAAMRDVVTCPLCHGGRTRLCRSYSRLLSLPEGAPHQVRRCTECGFLFLGPYLSPDEIDALYLDSYHPGMDYEVGVQALMQKYRRTLDDLLTIHPRARSVLDVGAATGEFLSLARDRGLEVEGLELSTWAVAKAAEKYGLNFAAVPFEKFEPRRQFDLIHLSHVLEHFPDPHVAVTKIRECLAPDGFVYIEVPFQFNAIESVAAKLHLRKRAYSAASIHHPSFFSPATLRRLFEKHGMTVQSLLCFNWDRYGNIEEKLKLPNRIARSLMKLVGQGQVIEGVFRHERR